MKVFTTERFERSFTLALRSVQRKFEKQPAFLLQDIRYPSLRAKKYDEQRGVWQARVDRTWRFYFLMQGDTYYPLDVIAYP